MRQIKPRTFRRRCICPFSFCAASLIVLDVLRHIRRGLCTVMPSYKNAEGAGTKDDLVRSDHDFALSPYLLNNPDGLALVGAAQAKPTRHLGPSGDSTR